MWEEANGIVTPKPPLMGTSSPVVEGGGFPGARVESLLVLNELASGGGALPAPPATEFPATDPPATDPPATEPPATDPGGPPFF